LGVALPAGSCTTHTVAEVLRKDSVVLLHSGCGRCVPIAHCAVNNIETCLSLIQPQLEVGTTTPREVLRTPFNVEDAVGCGAAYRGKDAKASVHQV
jgi:hypothetical protein